MAGLLRFGFIANFISEPVLKGFIIGLALTILVGQLPKLFGVEGGDGNFFEKLWDLVTDLGDTQWRTLTVGLISLAIVLVLRVVAPGSGVARHGVLSASSPFTSSTSATRASPSSATSRPGSRDSGCRRTSTGPTTSP